MSTTITLATIDYAYDYSDYAPARPVRVGVLASPGPARLPRSGIPSPLAQGGPVPWRDIENKRIYAPWRAFCYSIVYVY